MVLDIMAFASIGTVTSFVPALTMHWPTPHATLALPSASMPSLEIVITNLSFAEAAEHIWHDIAWDALALGTKQLYAL